MNQDFQSAAIKALVSEWLNGLLFVDPPDLGSFSPNQITAYKASAKRAADSKAYQGESARIIQSMKDAIALKSQNDIERAFYRGSINGIRLLSDALLGLSSGGRAQKEEE